MEEPQLVGLERLERIGAGGFGTVYRAWQPEFGRWVAVKVVGDRLTDGDDRRRFERERLAAGSLSRHPSIVTVFDHGVTSDERPYIVMELFDGGSLADRIREGGALSPDVVLDIGVQLAGALVAAHDANVLHRDVKPENVLFSAYGAPALADFGIARLPGATTTRSGVITASLAHAPPEVLGGEQPGPSADVYGLASTLWTAAVGHPPFERGPDEPLAGLIARIASAPPPDVPERLPGPLAAVLAAGLAKDPTKRPPDATAFAEQLRHAQEALGLPLTPLVVALGDMHHRAPTAGDATDPSIVGGEATTRPRPPAVAAPEHPRRRMVVLAAAILLVTAGGVGAWSMARPTAPAPEIAGLEGAARPTGAASPASSSAASSSSPAATPTPSPSPTAAPDGGGVDEPVTGPRQPSTAVPSTGTSEPGRSVPDTSDPDPEPDPDPDPDPVPTSSPSPSSPVTSAPSPTPRPTSSPTSEPNQPPVAAYTTRVGSGTDTVTFDASSASDPDGDTLTYSWAFNDGTANKTGKVVTHTFGSTADNNSSVWTVTLVVRDPDGSSSSSTSPTSVSMPNVYAMNSQDAFQAVRGAGLRPFYSPVWNDSVTHGSYAVWSQWPGAGTTVAGDAAVRIVVWEQDTCAANPDEDLDHWWCYEAAPPSPTLDRSYF